MFGKQTLLTSVVFGFLALLWMIQLAFVRPSDVVAYRTFARKTGTLASTHKMQAAKQQRQGVCKDIWIAQEQSPALHTRIESTASTLVLLPMGEKVDIMENLEGIRCWMQDRLFLNGNQAMQQMRFFEAATGTYQYTTQQFSAQTVDLSFFRIPGQTIALAVNPDTAFLRGIAQDVTFAVSGKSPQFQAQHFQAFLKHEESAR